MSCTAQPWPKSIKFVREGNEQQGRALPEDEDREEKANFIEYMSIYPSASLPEEAKIIQKVALFTLFSQCSFGFFLTLLSRSLFL